MGSEWCSRDTKSDPWSVGTGYLWKGAAAGEYRRHLQGILNQSRTGRNSAIISVNPPSHIADISTRFPYRGRCPVLGSFAKGEDTISPCFLLVKLPGPLLRGGVRT